VDATLPTPRHEPAPAPKAPGQVTL
jgi:hypothetical protein